MRILVTSVGLCVVLAGCAVTAPVGAAVTVASTAVKTTAKVAGAAVDVVIPDGE